MKTELKQQFNYKKYQPAIKVPPFIRHWPDNILTKAPIWVSEDLRDGNQALMAPMTVEQKKRFWQLLIKIGFKEIMVGFPAASQPDFDFVRWLIEAQQIPQDVTIAVLVQAREHLIDQTFAALEGVPRAIIHIYNSVSPVQRERVFKLTKPEITALAVQGVNWIKARAQVRPQTVWQLEYSPESFSSTEVDFSIAVCQAVIEAWQPTLTNKIILNLPSTVEVAAPNHYADQIEYFTQHISNRDRVIISVHTHNDRGGAVAAAELALLAGADRVEGTLLGNGERTGNADLVTLAMNLYSQGINPQLDLSNPQEIIEVVDECTHIALHPRHPWVGELVYTAFSGSHQDAIRKSLKCQKGNEPWQVAYLPIDPSDIGRDYTAIIRVNSQSGKSGIAFLLERDFNISLPRWLISQLAPFIQKVSEQRGGELSSQLIKQYLDEQFARQWPLRLDSFYNQGQYQITFILFLQQQKITMTGKGNGNLSAFTNAWQNYNGKTIEIIEYHEQSLTAGSDAQAIAFIQLKIDYQHYSGIGQHHDSLFAAFNAIIAAINNYLIVQEINHSAMIDSLA